METTKRKPPERFEPKFYQINDKYRIKSDPYCLILQRMTDSGKWVDDGYHSSLENLLYTLYQREIRENLGDLEYMKKLQQELLAEFKKLIGLVTK